MFGNNLMRNDGVNLGLNLYGKSKQILIDEGCKTDLMEVGISEEDLPIIVGDGKKRPRPNNDSFGSPDQELRWKNGAEEDHCPLLLDTDLSIGSSNSSRLGGQFRFETAWLLEDSCFEQVKTLWDSNKNVTVPERLNMMGEGLKRWISHLKKERGEVMEILTRRLRNLTAEEPSDEIIEATIQTK
ncbi:hypothetical protein GOBAR_DD25586 [Gossypium barbadense]|nr:hypothetical protein GOBAR_DD25586 [Gossypium barbadense]